MINIFPPLRLHEKYFCPSKNYMRNIFLPVQRLHEKYIFVRAEIFLVTLCIAPILHRFLSPMKWGLYFLWGSPMKWGLYFLWGSYFYPHEMGAVFSWGSVFLPRGRLYKTLRVPRKVQKRFILTQGFFRQSRFSRLAL